MLSCHHHHLLLHAWRYTEEEEKQNTKNKKTKKKKKKKKKKKTSTTHLYFVLTQGVELKGREGRYGILRFEQTLEKKFSSLILMSQKSDFTFYF